MRWSPSEMLFKVSDEGVPSRTSNHSVSTQRRCHGIGDDRTSALIRSCHPGTHLKGSYVLG